MLNCGMPSSQIAHDSANCVTLRTGATDGSCAEKPSLAHDHNQVLLAFDTVPSSTTRNGRPLMVSRPCVTSA